MTLLSVMSKIGSLGVQGSDFARSRRTIAKRAVAELRLARASCVMTEHMTRLRMTVPVVFRCSSQEQFHRLQEGMTGVVQGENFTKNDSRKTK